MWGKTRLAYGFQLPMKFEADRYVTVPVGSLACASAVRPPMPKRLAAATPATPAADLSTVRRLAEARRMARRRSSVAVIAPPPRSFRHAIRNMTVMFPFEPGACFREKTRARTLSHRGPVEPPEGDGPPRDPTGT